MGTGAAGMLTTRVFAVLFMVVPNELRHVGAALASETTLPITMPKCITDVVFLRLLGEECFRQQVRLTANHEIGSCGEQSHSPIYITVLRVLQAKWVTAQEWH
jgi:hypothetical protein